MEFWITYWRCSKDDTTDFYRSNLQFGPDSSNFLSEVGDEAAAQPNLTTEYSSGTLNFVSTFILL